MAVSEKEILLRLTGRKGRRRWPVTLVADDTSALTFDLFTLDIVMVEAEAAPGGTSVKDIIMAGMIPFAR